MNNSGAACSMAARVAVVRLFDIKRLSDGESEMGESDSDQSTLFGLGGVSVGDLWTSIVPSSLFEFTVVSFRVAVDPSSSRSTVVGDSTAGSESICSTMNVTGQRLKNISG